MCGQLADVPVPDEKVGIRYAFHLQVALGDADFFGAGQECAHDAAILAMTAQHGEWIVMAGLNYSAKFGVKRGFFHGVFLQLCNWVRFVSIRIRHLRHRTGPYRGRSDGGPANKGTGFPSWRE